MWIQLGSDRSAVDQAARQCGLDVFSDRSSFRYRIRPDCEFQHGEAEAVLCLSKTLRRRQLARRPSEIGLYRNDGLYRVIWDASEDDTLGLSGFIGQDGWMLVLAYRLEAVSNLMTARGFKPYLKRIGPDHTTHLEYANAMSQQKIKVRITKKGQTTVSTEGFQGTACKDVTKALEAALGTRVSEVETAEIHEVEGTNVAAHC